MDGSSSGGSLDSDLDPPSPAGGARAAAGKVSVVPPLRVPARHGPPGGRHEEEDDASSSEYDDDDFGTRPPPVGGKGAGKGAAGGGAAAQGGPPGGGKDALQAPDPRRAAKTTEGGGGKGKPGHAVHGHGHVHGHRIVGRHLGSSAPVLARRTASFVEDPRDEKSEGMGRASMAPSDDDGHERGGRHGPPGYRYPSYSWRETLSHIPGLLERYPLAASNDEGAGEDAPPGAEAEHLMVQRQVRSYMQLEGNQNEEYLNGHPSTSAVGRKQQQTPPPGGADGAVPRSPDNAHARLVKESSSQPLFPGAVPPAAVKSAPEIDANEVAAYGAPREVCRPLAATSPQTPVPAANGRWPAVTPHSAPVRRVDPWRVRPAAVGMGGGGGTGPWMRDPYCDEVLGDTVRQTPLQQLPPQGHRGPADASSLAAAWAEVNLAQQRLAQRERELAQREAAAWRAEARNRATARQLAELRRRLDDYGQELEEGVMAITSQQQALREERRQAQELQARARRMCAAAACDSAVGPKLREWERQWMTASM